MCILVFICLFSFSSAQNMPVSGKKKQIKKLKFFCIHNVSGDKLYQVKSMNPAVRTRNNLSGKI